MRKAFTLVEILMVIAMIVILAAILFPVVARARQGGHVATTMSQSKDLGKALLLYAEDFDEHFVPSTNYNVKESAENRFWAPLILPYAGKSERTFIADGSDGKFPKSWSERGLMSLGLSSALALDEKSGCKDGQSGKGNCLAFTTTASGSKLEAKAQIALLASTAAGPTDQKYRGYEFSPYNGQVRPDGQMIPRAADRDLVKELAPMLPADLIKPIFARYFSDLSNNGRTPVVFLDGHVKSYSAREILDSKDKIIWDFR
jgi:prepilin-type N-terminal cleavage/methylation domain-containing protein/prepilin-type processing-associated H-X9-DG protein